MNGQLNTFNFEHVQKTGCAPARLRGCGLRMDDGAMTDEAEPDLAERVEELEVRSIQLVERMTKHAKEFSKHVELSKVGRANHTRLSDNVADGWERIEKDMKRLAERISRIEQHLTGGTIGGVVPETPAMSELRDAYTALRQPPWNRHSEKMARLYSAIEVVLGGPIFDGAILHESTTITFDEPVGPIIGKDPERVAVVHAHGDQFFHPHSTADYAAHQLMEDEVRLDSTQQPAE